MRDTSTRRAILLFARTPEREAHAKRLSTAVSPSDRVSVYTFLTGRVLSELSHLSYSVIVATDDAAYNFQRFSPTVRNVVTQRGKSFQEKLINSLSDVFALGYDAVVCVGNDCPDLSSGDIEAAFSSIDTGTLVLGAAADGGAYLIGLGRDDLSTALCAMEDCRWETPSLLGDLFSRAADSGITAALLPRLSDIDTVDDLKRFACRMHHLPVLHRITAKLDAVETARRPDINPRPLTVQIPPLRFQKAPPHSA